MIIKEKKTFFFWKKSTKKTFAPLRADVPPSVAQRKNQSFFASFCSQKDVLACFFAFLLASCATPPPAAYIAASTATTAAGTPVGDDTAHEACTSQPDSQGTAIYCGTWTQPSARLTDAGPADATPLLTLATTSAWRARLDANYACAAPSTGGLLDGVPAAVLSCTQRQGGWPHFAFVTVLNNHVYEADGVLPALPPAQRALGILTGRLTAQTAGQTPMPVPTDALAQQLADEAFSSGDISHYDDLMAFGGQANQEEDFPAAVIAYRAALALQQDKLGARNPGTAAPMLELALNLSDQGDFPQAAGLFTAAAALTPVSQDPTAAAKLLHYEGLDQLNQGHDQTALVLLQRAEADYASLLPPDLFTPPAVTRTNEALNSITYQAGAGAQLADQLSLQSVITQDALLGVIETYRYEAVAWRGLGNMGASAAALAQSRQIAAANDIAPLTLAARLDRTSGLADAARGDAGDARAGLNDAAADFTAALPGSLPVAETAFLQAGLYHAQNDDADALAACRHGITLLENLRQGTSSTLIAPCLDSFAASAAQNPAQAEALHAEMFEAAELAQGSVTAREIGEAAARLSSSATDPQAASAIRAQQDAAANLAALYQQRDEISKAPASGGETLPGIDKQIAAAAAALQQDNQAVQAAAPNFGQLVQQVVPAADVMAALRPDEGFLGITSTPDHTWLFLLHNGRIDISRSALNDASMGRLVKAVLNSIEPGAQGLPSFDMADASAIYTGTLAPFAPAMASVHELVIAPSGPLLALPLALLPTGPATPDQLAAAPWLVRTTNLAYVPAAANFVALRKTEGTSAAQKPWFGFGDFQPVSLAQAQETYPATCGDSAALFANLPHLPYAALELQAGAAVFGATADDELTGQNFTVPNVKTADLKNYQILHFATHALLPTDLACQSQPAIVTSAPVGAASADDALLTTSDVTALHLDANLVVLSACNTGGAEAGGEALSGLARSFFYAGARALMVTQWSVNDQVSAFLVANTLQILHAGTSGGAAGSLRAAQLALINKAGNGMPAALADPFYWAAFAVIGDGGAAGAIK